MEIPDLKIIQWAADVARMNIAIENSVSFPDDVRGEQASLLKTESDMLSFTNKMGKPAIQVLKIVRHDTVYHTNKSNRCSPGYYIYEDGVFLLNVEEGARKSVQDVLYGMLAITRQGDIRGGVFDAFTRGLKKVLELKDGEECEVRI